MSQVRLSFPFGRGWYRDVLADLERLLAAGVPVIEALDTVGDSPRGQPAALARELAGRIRSGATLAEALAASPHVPEEDAALVEAGERSGALVAVLGSLVARLDRRRDLMAEMRAKVAYPAVVLAAAVTLLPLPWVFSGHALGYVLVQLLFWGSVAGLAVMLGLGWQVLDGKPDARLAVERAALRIPVLGRSLADADAGRSLGLLGLLFRAGLPVSTALPLAARSARLLTLRRALAAVEPRLGAGSTLTHALGAERFFSSRRQWLARVAAAEKAGALDQLFIELGEDLERSAFSRLGMVLRIVPVLLLIGVGILVLVQMLRVLLPLYGGI